MSEHKLPDRRNKKKTVVLNATQRGGKCATGQTNQGENKKGS